MTAFAITGSNINKSLKSQKNKKKQQQIYSPPSKSDVTVFVYNRHHCHIPSKNAKHVSPRDL